MLNVRDFLKNKYKSLIQALFKLFFGPVDVASVEEVKKYLSIEEIKLTK